ncbi:hydroxymethylbilane synthase [Nonlabens ulvanivorans]|uniref:hydroxymethylbilane synthase n=1 Tax=Nonlabens ulvanivorans TaxID=906888 RepID=UPI002943BA01|nr:hydroxymethylbilane synthase [Nonlabens ulvanivorans]WOI22444.1 hydroxymethylbilane synthase [Nonlabens ulvanivorans]
MSLKIRIGTRDSQLAMWQATTVQSQLEALGFQTELLPVKSQGDLNLDEPLYEMGITGIFTKTLDVALVKGDIDIAVHSLKDVPTQLPKGMVQAAVLERASQKDILVYKSNFNPDEAMTIATGSLRRKAQWLNMYSQHQVVDLRGNVNTRLSKLHSNKDWNAAIFAKAGLDRIGLLSQLRSNYGFEYSDLDSFVPAPAQGAMMIAAMGHNTAVLEAASQLNHAQTQRCVDIERRFLRELEGGCTAPIGAIAQVRDNKIDFTGCLLSIDGTERIDVKDQINLTETDVDLGVAFAKAQSEKVFANGGKALMQSIKSVLNS